MNTRRLAPFNCASVCSQTRFNSEVIFSSMPKTTIGLQNGYLFMAESLRGFSCWDQYLAMGFAQLTYRESLRDIEACLGSISGKLYHMGFRGKVARSNLADANEAHD